MNHLLREKNWERDPVITVEDGDKVMYVNRADVLHEGRVICSVVSGKAKGAAGHNLKAWVETEFDIKVS